MFHFPDGFSDGEEGDKTSDNAVRARHVFEGAVGDTGQEEGEGIHLQVHTQPRSGLSTVMIICIHVCKSVLGDDGPLLWLP